MHQTDTLQLRDEVIQGAEALIAAGVLSPSKHGNWSVRIPGTDLILLTGSSLVGMVTEDLAVVSLDGKVVEGGLSPSSSEIIHMHTVVYAERPGVGSVVHTHSPYATAFAVANRPLECYAEALARLGSADPIPVAAYAARGSDAAVGNILAALRESPGQKAVLLANHGILAFGPDVISAQRTVVAVEETAQLAVLASSIGTPRPLSAQEAAQTQERRRAFEEAAARA
jgi:L-fuculose-phosphate aldolase